MIGKRDDKTSTRAALVALATVLTPACIGLASCSLGLDESLIGLDRSEAGAADSPGADGPVVEGGDGALPPIQPEGGVCTKNEDCKSAGGCFTAKCDLSRKACVFDVCRQPACNSAACDTATQKCGAPKPYKYRATQFAVGAQIGCGGALGRCFAAVYPFVFVGTGNGVAAFSVADPQNPAPASVPIMGLGFLPTQIVASGSRVFFLGSPVGVGMSSRVPIAYVDVPPDPFAKKIAVTTILASYNRPPGDPIALLARGNDTALLVDLNGATSYAATPIEPPLVEPVNLGSTGSAFTAGSGPIIVSGSRLILGQVNGAGTPIFGFVNAAGSATPQTAPDVAIMTATPAVGPWYFATSPEGTVFWSLVALTAPNGGPPPPPGIRAAKGYFLVADGTANFDPASGIDLEGYGGAPQGTPTVGPVALLDANTALVTTSSPANPGMQTNVQFVTRLPAPALVKNADNSVRRFPITVPVSQLAAAGSNGIGYVLAVDPAAPTAPTVYVFDPACAP
jgi:hypothetical protein